MKLYEEAGNGLNSEHGKTHIYIATVSQSSYGIFEQIGSCFEYFGPFFGDFYPLTFTT